MPVINPLFWDLENARVGHDARPVTGSLAGILLAVANLRSDDLTP